MITYVLIGFDHILIGIHLSLSVCLFVCTHSYIFFNFWKVPIGKNQQKYHKVFMVKRMQFVLVIKPSRRGRYQLMQENLYLLYKFSSKQQKDETRLKHRKIAEISVLRKNSKVAMDNTHTCFTYNYYFSIELPVKRS